MASSGKVSTSVVVRFRPASASESSVKCVDCLAPTQLTYKEQEGAGHAFTFDKVYGACDRDWQAEHADSNRALDRARPLRCAGEEAGQQEVFGECSYVVDAVLQGNNGTIISYGQTGSGKTHTLIVRSWLAAVGNSLPAQVLPLHGALAQLAGALLLADCALHSTLQRGEHRNPAAAAA